MRARQGHRRQAVAGCDPARRPGIVAAGVSGPQARDGRHLVSPGTGFTILSRLPINYGPSPRCGIESRWERRFERSCIAIGLSGPGAQRGLPAAELLPAVAVVVAGRDQGGLSRAGEHRRQLRSRRALAELRDEAAERGVAENLRKALDASRLHPVQCVSARPLRLPILRRARRSDLRPPGSALARRAYGLEQCRRGLLAVQSEEGQSHPRRIEDVAVAAAVSADGTASAPERPAVPAELPARQLARLFVLGYRTRSVRPCSPDQRSDIREQSIQLRRRSRISLTLVQVSKNYAAATLRAPARAGATSAMKRAISSLT